ncbi:MAG: hypothetical protein H8D67_12725 [Deltaproteobacteria bacterium]|nr:hypothetical protein [Deltaproteobacteria bacterium]
MATLMRLVEKVIVQDRTIFPSESGTVYIVDRESEDGAKRILDIYGDTTTVANYNTGPDIGSKLTDTSDGTCYVKTAATTWTKIGTQS